MCGVDVPENLTQSYLYSLKIWPSFWVFIPAVFYQYEQLYTHKHTQTKRETVRGRVWLSLSYFDESKQLYFINHHAQSV